MERIFVCSIHASRSTVSKPEIILFGSSRTGAAFDSPYIENILQFEQTAHTPAVQKLAITGPDFTTAYSFLQNSLANRDPPKIILLELMLVLKNNNRKSVPAIQPRHYAILNANQLIDLKTQLQSNGEGLNLIEILSTYIHRFTHLLYGFLKHPFPDFWSPCATPSEWSRNGAWPYRDHVATGGTQKEIANARNLLTKNLERVHDANISKKWFLENYNKNDSKPVYDLDEKYRQSEIAIIKKFLQLAKSHGVKTILLPLTNFGENLSIAELSRLKKLFPSTAVYDVIGQAGHILDFHWRDRRHVSKDGAKLTSSLLAHRINQELSE